MCEAALTIVLTRRGGMCQKICNLCFKFYEVRRVGLGAGLSLQIIWGINDKMIVKGKCVAVGHADSIFSLPRKAGLNRYFLSILTILFFFASMSLSAQEITGRILGSVLDSS